MEPKDFHTTASSAEQNLSVMPFNQLSRQDKIDKIKGHNDFSKNTHDKYTDRFKCGPVFEKSDHLYIKKEAEILTNNTVPKLTGKAKRKAKLALQKQQAMESSKKIENPKTIRQNKRELAKQLNRNKQIMENSGKGVVDLDDLDDKEEDERDLHPAQRERNRATRLRRAEAKRLRKERQARGPQTRQLEVARRQDYCLRLNDCIDHDEVSLYEGLENNTSTNSNIKITRTIVLVPEVGIHKDEGLFMDNAFWDWRIGTKYFSPQNFRDIVFSSMCRMGFQLERFKSISGDHPKQYAHMLAATCMGYQLTFYFTKKPEGTRMTYFRRLGNKADLRMFACFTLPLFQDFYKYAQCHKFYNHLTKEFVSLRKHTRLADFCTHSALALPVFDADAQHFEGQFLSSAYNWFKQKTGTIVARFLHDLISQQAQDAVSNVGQKVVGAVSTIKNLIIDLFEKIKDSVCRATNWVWSKLKDAANIVVIIMSTIFETLLKSGQGVINWIKRVVDMKLFREDDIELRDVVSGPMEDDVEFFDGQAVSFASGISILVEFVTEGMAYLSREFISTTAAIGNLSATTTKFFSSLPRVKQGVEITGEFIRSCISTVYYWFTGCHYSDSDKVLFELQQEIENFNRIYEQAQKLHGSPMPPNLMASVTASYSKLQSLRVLAAGKNPSQHTHVNNLLKAVDEVSQRCVTLQRSTTTRIKPVCIMLHGPAAMGKSTTVGDLMRHIHEEFAEMCRISKVTNPYEGVDPSTSIATFQCHEDVEFLENYHNQASVKLEEFQSSLNMEVNVTWGARLQSWLDTSFVPINKAFEDKGQVGFDSPLIIGTTNRDDFVYSATSTDAFDRRMDFDMDFRSVYKPGQPVLLNSSFKFTKAALKVHSNPRLAPHTQYQNLGLTMTSTFTHIDMVKMGASLLYNRVFSKGSTSMSFKDACSSFGPQPPSGPNSPPPSEPPSPDSGGDDFFDDRGVPPHSGFQVLRLDYNENEIPELCDSFGASRCVFRTLSRYEKDKESPHPWDSGRNRQPQRILIGECSMDLMTLLMQYNSDTPLKETSLYLRYALYCIESLEFIAESITTDDLTDKLLPALSDWIDHRFVHGGPADSSDDMFVPLTPFLIQARRTVVKTPIGVRRRKVKQFRGQVKLGTQGILSNKVCELEFYTEDDTIFVVSDEIFMDYVNKYGLDYQDIYLSTSPTFQPNLEQIGIVLKEWAPNDLGFLYISLRAFIYAKSHEDKVHSGERFMMYKGSFSELEDDAEAEWVLKFYSVMNDDMRALFVEYDNEHDHWISSEPIKAAKYGFFSEEETKDYYIRQLALLNETVPSPLISRPRQDSKVLNFLRRTGFDDFSVQRTVSEAIVRAGESISDLEDTLVSGISAALGSYLVNDRYIDSDIEDNPATVSYSPFSNYSLKDKTTLDRATTYINKETVWEYPYWFNKLTFDYFKKDFYVSTAHATYIRMTEHRSFNHQYAFNSSKTSRMNKNHIQRLTVVVSDSYKKPWDIAKAIAMITRVADLNALFRVLLEDAPDNEEGNKRVLCCFDVIYFLYFGDARPFDLNEDEDIKKLGLLTLYTRMLPQVLGMPRRAHISEEAYINQMAQHVLETHKKILTIDDRFHRAVFWEIVKMGLQNLLPAVYEYWMVCDVLKRMALQTNMAKVYQHFTETGLSQLIAESGCPVSEFALNIATDSTFYARHAISLSKLKASVHANRALITMGTVAVGAILVTAGIMSATDNEPGIEAPAIDKTYKDRLEAVEKFAINNPGVEVEVTPEHTYLNLNGEPPAHERVQEGEYQSKPGDYNPDSEGERKIKYHNIKKNARYTSAHQARRRYVQSIKGQFGGDGEGILQRILANSYDLYASFPMGGETLVGHFTFVHGNVASMNFHVFHQLPETFTIENATSSRLTYLIHKSDVNVLTTYPDRDLMYVQFPQAVQAHSNLFKYAMTKTMMHNYAGSTVCYALREYDSSNFDWAAVEGDPSKESTIPNSMKWEALAPLTAIHQRIVLHFDSKAQNVVHYLATRDPHNKPGMSGGAYAAPTKNGMKFMGIHMGGDQHKGSVSVTPIWKEDEHEFMAKLKPSDPVVIVGQFCGEHPAQAYQTTSMANFTTTVITSATNATNLKKTPMHDHKDLFEAPSRPAQLTHEAYVRARLRQDIKAHSARSLTPTALRLLRDPRVVSSKHFFSGPIPHQLKNCRYLTAEEALYGDGNMISAFDFSTADGITLKKMGIQKKNLADINHPDTGRFIEMVNAAMAQLQKGEYWFPVTQECLKDELRDHERYAAGKTRLFFVGDFLDNVLQKMILGDFMARLKGYSASNASCCGVSPGRTQWKMLYALFSKSKKILEMDIGGNDFVWQPLFAELLSEFVRPFYNLSHTEPAFKALYWAFWGSIHALRFNKGFGFFLGSGLISGAYDTTLFNTLCNYILHNSIFYYLMDIHQPHDYLKDINEKCELVPRLYSDDNLSTCDEATWWTTENFVRAADEIFGIEMTSNDKSGNTTLADRTTINDCMFLSRGFAQHESNPGLICAPLKMQSLLGQLFYVRATSSRANDVLAEIEQLNINIANVVGELKEYPYAIAMDIYGKLQEFQRREKLRGNHYEVPPFTTFMGLTDKFVMNY